MPLSPSPRLGPILRLRGSDDGTLRLSVTLFDADAPGAATIGHLAGVRVRAVDLRLPVGSDGRAPLPADLRDAVPALPATVAAPGPAEALRLAFASCNGGEDPGAMDDLPGGRNAMWSDLAARHAERPFDLILMGGDQIYADALWDLPEVAAWRRLPRRSRLRAPFTDAMRAQLEAHYLAVYAQAFGSPEVAWLLASVPSVMMWDDHDIVDGWGSRDPRWQAAPVPQGLFEVARRAFALVQMGLDPDEPTAAADGFAGDDAGFAWFGSLGPVRLAVPDLRSHRTRTRVMDDAGHAALAAVDGHGLPHAIVLSTVPLVNADLSGPERLVRPLMAMADVYQDDLRDQWMSHAHRVEWMRVMDRLLTAAAAARVTVLSGEIHLAAAGSARRGDRRVDQLIASGIAHPPPPPAFARVMSWFARRMRRRGDVALGMRPVMPDGRLYLAERNWLEVEARPDGALIATLHAEESGRLRWMD
jgi:hypothetical protein